MAATKNAKLVGAQENEGPALVCDREDRGRDVDELVDIGLEEFIARIVLQHPEEILPEMRIRGEPGPRHHGLDLLSQEGHADHRLGIRAGGEQAEEATLPGEPGPGRRRP